MLYLMMVRMTKIMVMMFRETYTDKNCIFFNIVQKALGPLPPHRVEHLSYNFSRGLLKSAYTSVAMKIDKIMFRSKEAISNLDLKSLSMSMSPPLNNVKKLQYWPVQASLMLLMMSRRRRMIITIEH